MIQKNKFLLCPQCYKEIGKIEKIFFNEKNILNIKFKCSYIKNILIVPLNEYLTSNNNNNNNNNNSNNLLLNFNKITNEDWNKTNKKIPWKNFEEINEIIEKEKNKIKNFKENQIKIIDNIIKNYENIKQYFNEQYNYILDKNYLLYNLLFILYSNFIESKNSLDKNSIENINILDLNKIKNLEKNYKNFDTTFNWKKNSYELFEQNIKEYSNTFYNKYLFIYSLFKLENNFLNINKSKNNFILNSNTKNNQKYKIKYNKNFFLKNIFSLEMKSNINCIIELQNKEFAISTSNGEINIFSNNTFQKNLSINAHKDSIWEIIQLKNELIASCSDDNTIKFWNIYSHKKNKFEFEFINSEEVGIQTIKQINENLLISSSYNKLKIWDLNTKKVVKIFEGHQKDIMSICLFNDNKIISGSYDKTIKIWDINNNECEKTLKGHKSYVWKIIKIKMKKYQNNNYDLIASCSTDKTIKIWDINSEKILINLEGHIFTVLNILQLKNEKLISCSYDNSIKIWNLNTESCEMSLIGHSSAVWSICQLNDGKLISVGWDKKILIWE